jgi:hypothetical protein
MEQSSHSGVIPSEAWREDMHFLESMRIEQHDLTCTGLWLNCESQRTATVVESFNNLERAYREPGKVQVTPIEKAPSVAAAN